MGRALLIFATSAAPARAGLDDYLKRDDPAFAWKVVKTDPSEVGTATHLQLTSQTWQGLPWNHQLSVYEPVQLIHEDTVLLFITGGKNGDPSSMPRQEDMVMGFALSNYCGARVAVLAQVPNQPLLGGKSEDALIAETFVRYLETKDESWPLLFPMVKSAVKAMDAVQQWTDREKRPAVKQFVVTGASKRGWTTWLAGASDPRVIAIAPMVIDTLNMKAQKAHAIEVWGKTSEQIDDYTRRGLTDKFDDPTGKILWKMVDPYTYRDRLAMPKLLINGTNDRYWTLDALNIYWDDLKGPKSVVYLPNAGHNLAVNRDFALKGIGAFFRHVAGHSPWPDLSWKHGDGEDGRLTLSVTSSIVPKSVRLWVARSNDRDFRDSTWTNTEVVDRSKSIRMTYRRPDAGSLAAFGDLEFETNGLSYHLSTQIRETRATRTTP